MRIAVLADIHGNLPALRAVLAEIDQDPVDAIVVAGDVVGGPLVRETLELLGARRQPTRCIGRLEREAVAIYDGAWCPTTRLGGRPRGAPRRSTGAGGMSSRRGR